MSSVSERVTTDEPKDAPRATFINIGERTNVTGSARFKKLILEGDYNAAIEVARQQVESGAQIIDINMDEGLLDAELAMDTFLKLIAAEPDIARVPIMIDSSKWSVIEAGLKCVAGKPIVNSISMKEGIEPFIAHARKVRRYGAAVVVMAFDEKGQADTRERKVEICAKAYDILVNQVGFRPRTSSSIPTSSRSPPASRSTTTTASTSSRPRARSRCAARTPRSRAACRTSASPSAATSRCARPCIRCFSTMPSRPAWTWASSMRASSRSTTRSRRSCATPARTSSSTATPRPPSDCSSWRPKYKGTGEGRRDPGRRMAQLAGREAAGACAGQGHGTSSSSPTPRRRACRSRGRSRSSRAR